MEEDKVRLFVGGLASGVTARDLQERFAPLGRVESIVLPPVKGDGVVGHRGFAYVDFIPATDASLRKLYSAYNGCKWRGGFLRIEKAQESYTDRLNREWASAAEAATLSMTKVPEQVHVDQRSVKANGRENGGRGVSKDDRNSADLNIFFPRFRKVKAVPLSGLGKHKRSFQRVESSPLHLLSACDCDEALRSGSCNCAKMSKRSSASKVETISEADDIALEIVNERERQLELLSRLFPSDAASDRLEEQPAVELDEIDGRDIGGNEDAARGTGARKKPSVPVASDGRTFDHTDSLPRTETEDLNQSQKGKLGTNAEGDSSVQLVANERAKELELMNRLTGNEDPIASREPERARPEVSKARGKRKRDPREEDPNPIVFPKPDLQTADGQITNEEGSNEALKPPMAPDKSKERTVVGPDSEGLKSSKKQEFTREGILAPLSDRLLQHNAQKLSRLEDSGSSPLREDKGTELLKEASLNKADDMPDEDDDSDMVLNLGDDELSPAIAEEQEKLLLKNLSVTADEASLQKDSKADPGVLAPLQKDVEADPVVLRGSLSQEGHLEEGLQAPESPQEVPSDDSLEDAELTLNISYDIVPPSSVDERERRMPIGTLSSDNPSSRTATAVDQQSNKLGASGSSNDEASNPDLVRTAEESKPSSTVESGADHTKGAQRGGLSQSDQKLTRAAWKSLVGETGRVVFSLRQAIGSGESDLPPPSPTQETLAVDKGIVSPLHPEKPTEEAFKFNKSNSASLGQALENNRREPGRQPQADRTEPIRTPVSPSPSLDTGCLFMKSENAEREWLATKSKLRSDYRAKHRYAARHMKKLWSK